MNNSNTHNNSNIHIGILGAGIIGVSCACALVEKGFNVTLIDPAPPGEGGASKGNAAQIIPSVVFPLASPHSLKNSLHLLTAPDSPLTIPPAYRLAILPWLMRFSHAALPHNYKSGTAALTSINEHAHTHFKALLDRANLSSLLDMVGAIQLHENRQNLENAYKTLKSIPVSHTGEIAMLDETDLKDKEPALAPIFKGGIFIPYTGVLCDPLEVVRALANYAQKLGVNFVKKSATDISVTPNTATIHYENTKSDTFDRAVIAAGVWSKKFLDQLAEPLPLEAERGYNLTLPLPHKAINHALVFAEHGIVATQVTSGLRFGGWDELGGTELPQNPVLFERMQKLASRLLPDFNWQAANQWMGMRPSLPNSLPVIGRSKKHIPLYYAFGHGHLGMTQGPITGAAIAHLIAGEKAPFDLAPFRPR